MHRNNIWKAEKNRKTDDLTFNTNLGQPSPSDSRSTTTPYSCQERASCEHVIHAVGPNFYYMSQDGPSGGILLEKAYERALLLAREKGGRLTSVAFCILSGGIYRGYKSLPDVIKHGLRAIAKNAYPSLDRVMFCMYTPGEQDASREAIERPCCQAPRERHGRGQRDPGSRSGAGGVPGRGRVPCWYHSCAGRWSCVVER